MKRLVLVGGGLVHLEVVRRLARSPFPDTDVILISDRALSVYAGMLPGVVAGHYRVEAMTVDVAGLAAAAGVRFHQGAVRGLDHDACELVLDDTTRLAFTHVSFNTGAEARPIAARPRHDTLSIKPALSFVSDLASWENRADADRPAAVIGGGVSGIEMAFALAHRWRGRRAAPVLIERSGTALDRVPAAARNKVRDHLRRAGIAVHREEADLDLGLAVNAAGAVAPDWLAQTGLARNDLGYLAIRPTLQVPGHDNIFAAGDVASVVDHPRAKAGVFAVRQGPVLHRNLGLALAGGTPAPHHPQTDWLSLIATGAKHAIGTRNGIAVEGRWVWHLKDINDRGYLRRYRTLAERKLA
ncbi:MAG: FAD-dependent oxidoreductase [Rhizobiaceae bacterium]